MKCVTLITLILLFCVDMSTLGQTKDPKDTEVWEPEPRVVVPGQKHSTPSDAIVLFDGKNLSEWVGEKNKKVKWKLRNGAMVVEPGSGDIHTKKKFGDCQLHIEWKSPEKIKGEGQGRGNSGIFLQLRYEVQILDSYNNRTYSNGQAGSVYKQYIPLVNASKKPGEWQWYDIIFISPKFNEDGIHLYPGRLTIFHNGVLIHNNVKIQGTTEYIGLPKIEAHGEAPLKLQDHGDLVSYRNIWIRTL